MLLFNMSSNSPIYHFQASCLKIACPFTSLMVGDRCVPIIEKVRGANFQYRIDFVIGQSDKQIPSYDELLYETQRLVYGDNIEYETICESITIRSRIDEDYLVVETLLSRTMGVSTSIREEYERLKNLIETKNQEYVAESIPYRVRLGSSLASLLDLNRTMFVAYEIGECNNRVALDELQFCRFVVVKDLDFDFFDGDIKEHEYLPVADLFGELNIYMCEYVYVQKMLEHSGKYFTTSSGMQYWSNVIATMLISVFGLYL